MIFKKHIRSREAARRRVFLLLFWGVGVLAGAGVLAGIGAWVSFQPAMRIAEVRVEGNKVVSAPVIREDILTVLDGTYLGIFNKAHAFTYPRREIQRTILAHFPRVREISVHRDSLTALVVSVSERAPAGLWCENFRQPAQFNSADKCFFFDASGFLYAPAPYFTGHVYFTMFSAREDSPLVRLGEYVLPPKLFARVQKLREALTALGLEPVLLRVEPHGDFAFLLPNAVELRFNQEQDFSAVVHNLVSAFGADSLSKQDLTVASSSIAYVDLRFGNKIFVK